MIFNITAGKKWIYDRVTVTITGNTSTSTYDANNHTASGYTVSISNPSYKTTDFSFSGTASATGKNAGTYNMNLASSQFTNNNDTFRNVVFVVTDGHVKINRKAVTVKADNKSKTYGSSDPTLTATVTGLLGSDTVSYSLSRASGSNVGTYTITPSGNATQGNYSVTYQTGTFTINRKAVTVKADNKSKTYGASDPTLTATVTGLLGSDTVSYSISRASGNNAGTYTITPSGTVNQGNYSVTYQTGTFTINPASCTLTANSGTKTYNGSNQSVTGFTCSVSGLSFSGVSASGTGKNAGSYSVTFSGVTVNTTKDTTGNYKVTAATKGTLTINPASCTLTANSGTKTYNGSSQSVTGFTSSPSGLSFSGVSASGSRKDVGSSDVTFSGVTINTTKDTTGNYKVTGTTKGTITINKAAASALGLSVTSYSGTYDGFAHTITATTTVTSGTTLYYRTSTTGTWVTTKPTRTDVGTTTVYVEARNNNYNTASATGTITIADNKVYIFKYGTGLISTASQVYGCTIGINGIVSNPRIASISLNFSGPTFPAKHLTKMYIEIEYSNTEYLDTNVVSSVVLARDTRQVSNIYINEYLQPGTNNYSRDVNYGSGQQDPNDISGLIQIGTIDD